MAGPRPDEAGQAEHPGADQPSTGQPGTGQPSSDHPSSEERGAGQPSPEQPATGQPSTEQPDAGQAATAAEQPEGPWFPWGQGAPRARDILCLIGIMVSGVYGLAMIPFTPRLISTHPVLLEILAGSNSSTVAAGAFAAVQGKLELGVVVLAALPGMMKFDLVFWLAGLLWGHRIIQLFAGRSRRAARFAQRAERLSPRWAAVAVLTSAFLPVPSPLVYAVAGWVGLRLVWFLICDVIGTAAWAAVLGTLGYILGDDGVRAANLVSRYALITIIVLVVLALVPHARHVIRSRPTAQPDGDGQPAPQSADLVAAVPVKVQPDSSP